MCTYSIYLSNVSNLDVIKSSDMHFEWDFYRYNCDITSCIVIPKLSTITEKLKQNLLKRTTKPVLFACTLIFKWSSLTCTFCNFNTKSFGKINSTWNENHGLYARRIIRLRRGVERIQQQHQQNKLNHLVPISAASIQNANLMYLNGASGMWLIARSALDFGRQNEFQLWTVDGQLMYQAVWLLNYH